MSHIDSIRSHLLRGLSISPMEARGVYTIPYLPRVIHDLKTRHNTPVITVIKKDPLGNKYARYWMAKVGMEVITPSGRGKITAVRTHEADVAVPNVWPFSGVRHVAYRLNKLVPVDA